MEVLLLILIAAIGLYFVFRKRAPSSNETPVSSHPVEREPRDYLKEADGWLNAPAPLKELLNRNRDEVMRNLVNAVNLDSNVQFTIGTTSIPMSPTIRKAAVYALGQIGEPSTIETLADRLNREQASGVKEAIVASISAIKLAPAPQHSELERRRIIGDVYDGRMPAQI